MQKGISIWSILIFSFIIMDCVTNGHADANTFSLDNAIEQTVEKIAGGLEPGTRLAIVAFQSESDQLSEYIMEELTGTLTDTQMEVADRRNLAYVSKELDFHLSGDVSDETAQSIGKFIGAELVISGELINTGGLYRYRVSAIVVESLARASSTRLNVRKDRNLRSLIASLGSNAQFTHTVDYEVKTATAPKTAGSFLDRGILFASRGEYEMAIEDFTEAIKINADYGAAYLLRGRAYYAKASYVTSIGENFDSVSTLFLLNRNLSEEERRNSDFAIADFT
jgi:tetratricopeptide (TPR) repeat protein